MEHKDRITMAWELRRDIHAFLKSHNDSPMSALIDHFAHRKPETVRKAVIRMRADGDVAIVYRQGQVSYYRALSVEILSEAAKRAGLAAGGHKNQHYGAEATRKKINTERKIREKLQADLKATQEAKKAKAALLEPWRYVHKHNDSGNKFRTLSGQLIEHEHNHGGQGAIRPGVFIKSCMG